MQDATAAWTNITLGYVLDEWFSGRQVEEATRATYRRTKDTSRILQALDDEGRAAGTAERLATLR